MLSHDRADVRRYYRVLREDAAVGAAASGCDADSGIGHAGTDGRSVYHRAQGVLSVAGHRGYPGSIGSAADSVIRGNGATATSSGASDSEGSGGREPVIVYRYRWYEHYA